MNRQHRLMIVLGLLGLSCLVQVVVIRRATTTGLDAVGFVDFARSIDRQGLLETVRTHGQQPLFPVWVWLVHEGLQRTTGEFPSSWATSAQLAAAIPLVLAILPLYYLLLRLVGGAAAVAGSIFFCVLPEVSRLGADGISDSTHLLFFCIAFWGMVEYLERRKAEGGRPFRTSLWLLLAGGATAVAALARAEGLVLGAALGLTLAGFQLLPGRREAWGRLAAASACFLLGLALVWTPYLAATGAVTPRAAAARILGRHQVELQASRPVGARLAESWLLPGGEPMSFDAKERGISLRRRGYEAAVVRFGRKLADATGYWIGALALLGAWRLRRAAATCRQGQHAVGRATAGDRFVQVFFLLFSVLAVRFSAAEGYLVPRHLMALVVASMGAAGYGVLELSGWLTGRASRPGHAARYTATAWFLVAAAGLACLPQTFMRLHHSRLGHRAAGQWLAGRTDLPGAVLDTQGWTGLYSGRETYAYASARAALGDPHLAYLVLEGREVGYSSGRSRTLRWLIERAARPVAEFPDPAKRKPNQEPVIVYRWDADRFLGRVQANAVGSHPAGSGRPRRAGAAAGRGETGIAASTELGVDSRAALRRAGPQSKL